MPKIAVIQTAFPGDVILCTTAFAALKDEGYTVTAVIRPQAEPLVRHNPNIDNLIIYEKRGGAGSFFKAANELKRTQSDAALIVQRYFKSGLLPIYAGIEKRIGYDSSSVNFLYTDTVPYDGTKHEVHRCLSLCQGLVSHDDYTPEIFLSPEDEYKADEILKNIGLSKNQFIVFAPGSVWDTKRWRGYDTLAELVKNRLNLQVVLLGAPSDQQICEQISKSSGAYNLAGKTDILVSSAIIKRSLLTLANDSAPAHIAAAVGTPVVAIFGPTVPSFGFTPYSKKSMVIENKGLYCRPCSSHGPKICPEKHFRCMKDIPAEKVFDAVKSLINYQG